MSSNFIHLIARDTESTISPTMINLLIALLVLLIVSLLLVGALLYYRQRRRARKQQDLLVYDEKRTSTSSTQSSHRRIMIRPSESVYVVQEKQTLINGCDNQPASPVPEIRITFPEEIDETGKRTSGRVVIVRVGETGVGLESVAENLPAYQQDGERFQSLDLERIGGLTEKEHKQWN